MLKLSTFLAGFAVALAALRARADQIEPGQLEFFEKKIRPILVEHCYCCHSARAKKLKGELRLDSRAAMLKGGESGPVLVPGRPDKSRLIEAVRYKNVELQMPPAGKLPEAVIADLAAWIKMGAPWATDSGTAKESETAKIVFDLQERKRAHWAWQPIRSPNPPAVKHTGWPRTPADRFILAPLEEKNLKPAPTADKRTLLRRVYFDLIGLPPAPADVAVFLGDDSPDALEKVVDRLLASPHFGERWGRHWLDLVRYAETRGHEYDYTAPNAYQYRDYVVRAINADVPYDRFVTEHIAGDLMVNPRLHRAEGFNESVLGTGFWLLGEEVHSPVDLCQDQADRFDNRIDVMGKTFLGLTVACARCHDHKFDAISTRDYYALFGFLKSSAYRLVRFDSLEHNRRIAGELKRVRDQSRPVIQRAIASAMQPGVERVADYLLAARQVMRAGRAADRKQVARKHKVDEAILGRWVEHLNTAAKDASDPFHLWAKAAGDRKPLTDLLRQTVEAWRQRGAFAATALNDAEVIVDYARLKPESWLPDGVAFGSGPVRPGEVRFGDDAARPILKVFDYAAAEKDPTWNGLKPAPGAENDPGALGGTVRSGRTILTPTFKVKKGTVYYLVKGTGLAYAAVDSHVMIAGPLHAQLVRPIEVRDGFRWIAHDLSAYKGLDAHLEFTATAPTDFAVAMVVLADRAPGPIDRPNQLLLKMLERNKAGSLKELAKGYQEVMVAVTRQLANDGIIGSEDAVDSSKLAGWLVQRPDLFAASAEAVARQVAPVARPLLAAQAELVARIRNESRLALAILDGSGADEHVYIRGTHKAPGALVARRFLEALTGAERLSVAHGSGRLELARQMTDPARDPLLARVMVNRIWHHLFGRGIVGSVDNFGVLGEMPTHPELLDYLASRFIQDGWSVKKMIRELILSSSYRMSSRPDPNGDEADPRNRLLHRMRIRRLEGEAIRDAMLSVSGRLTSRMYGPSVPVFLTPFLEGRGRPASGPLDGDGRRSLYLAVRRNFLSPMLMAFDTPIPFSTVGKRTVSNVPAQALILMNDPFVHQQVRHWAERALAGPGSTSERIRAMYLSAFARPPTDAELRACLAFLQQQSMASEGRTPNDRTMCAWADLAHVLVNAKEFIFLQ
jgi:hypothetical protein